MEVPQVQFPDRAVDGVIDEMSVHVEGLDKVRSCLATWQDRQSVLDAEVTKSKANADSGSGNEGHHDKICDRDSDAVLDACFTCDPKYEVACDTCAKNNMVTAAGEVTVTGKCNHESRTKRCAEHRI